MISKYSSKIRHPLVANSFYLYTAHFADYILSFLILPFIARKLGPSSLGEVALAQTFGIFCLLFMEYGFSLSATRTVARLKEDKTALRLFLNQSYSFKILLIPVIFVLALVLIGVLPIFTKNPHFIIIVSIGSIMQGLAPTWYFQGIEKLKFVAQSKIIFRIIGFIFILIFVQTPQDGWLVLTGYSVTSACILSYLFLKMKKDLGRIKWLGLQKALQLGSNNKWGFFITVIPVIYQSLSAFLMGVLVTPAQLGFLFGAGKIHRAFNSLFGPLGQAVYPRLVSLSHGQSMAVKSMLKKLMMIMLGLGLLFAGILIGIPEIMINIILGDAFSESVSVLQLFGFVLPLTAISHVLGRQWMLVKFQEKPYGIILCIASVVAFGFVWLSIEQYKIHTIPLSMILFEVISIGLITIHRIFKPSES